VDQLTPRHRYLRTIRAGGDYHLAIGGTRYLQTSWSLGSGLGMSGARYRPGPVRVWRACGYSCVVTAVVLGWPIRPRRPRVTSEIVRRPVDTSVDILWIAPLGPGD
jgi:hypothetical protein